MTSASGLRDGSARSTVEVIADELGPSLRWATATTPAGGRLGGRPRPANQPGLEDVKKPHGQHRWCPEGRVAATVRGVAPNKAGQPGCSVLLREREDGPWLAFGAVFVTETSVVWDGGVSGVRYGTDSPTGDVDDTPNAMLQPDGSLVLR
jgi:hypothetical protein